MQTKKIIILSIIIPLILILLSGGGYLAYNELQGQHADNLKDLEKFGFSVIPLNTHSETTGALGAKQLPATFAEKKTTPTQKVIKGLMDDNEQLIAEQEVLQAQISSLKAEINALQEYKKLNEHFAPLTITEEVAAVEQQLKKLLIDMPDARRFSNLQIEAMSASAGNEYKKFIGGKRLILSDIEREALVKDYMPAFSFCVGDGIDIAANSPREERLITTFFRKQDSSILSSSLKTDLDTVIKPCQTALYARLSDYDTPM
ncbi:MULTISPECIES: hypothetical protein [unclassified Neptuniibacter]|uniref:hypothetical protein n=1 Tax=unclassified Neptuniibacter TaxID=2630693 RepID=UPI000C55BD91|nr:MULTISPECIES: hypothetical protein [unclassified Neptuniibacter]MAY42288.1 hypothetical protein [Oceanospirillaceae bacterium]|tara:strand:- start:27415 stop:28194 length:780 start_codon:yes stop_codon:yes gene_type:complete